VLIAAGAAVGRAYYLDHVGAAYRTIAGAPFDALISPLRAWTRLTFAVALVTFVGVWLAGSDALVAREKRARSLLAEIMRENARALAIAGALLTAVLLVAWDKPRPVLVYSMIGVLAVWEIVCLTAGRVGPHGGTGGPAAPN
jgi:O-antigen/teichoic acid export membrane protein